ncbi:4-hydroxy-tetrahydrodipicolinate synthase [Halobacteriovorax vibrionivorans]|uniref:4-hydroxy-tetrahydrodipicolinate synthase n=1 Tax=Halobacteriovorax vibrionivorans TaxID=2152716 RepID=A0ABY0IDJ6_9BACT|nr:MULTISPECIES: 4-hydroxy-tetrahydrodipicolinate synthase [Halobacteriovorax]RZF20670.1 4-hydroxy-tetrahydrodipicolinate synthase [Halobacteriovorax vibrionivorans]TGD48920.1 4-hydroxy-tetrahydrodipicolinate synthase [Halobacteriovorax sp. Y22]
MNNINEKDLEFLNSTPLWTAVITPLHEDQTVDLDSLERILRAQEEAGNGILILGSTGEALNLNLEERKNILNFTIDLDLKVPLMCGVGGINLNETCEWVSYLDGLDIDAYLLVTPLYAKPGDEGQYHWFKTLMDVSNKPVMLYNVPSRAGIGLSLEAVKRLNGHRAFWAIKEASGSVEMFAKYVEAANGGRVYSGDDAMLPAFTPLGAKGLVSVAANPWPAETNKYVRDCLNGELNESDAQMWIEASNTMFVCSNPVPAKWLMKEQGQIETAVLRPPLSLKDMTKESIVKSANDKIKNWRK